jgi:hypothetical protein
VGPERLYVTGEQLYIGIRIVGIGTSFLSLPTSKSFSWVWGVADYMSSTSNLAFMHGVRKNTIFHTRFFLKKLLMIPVKLSAKYNTIIGVVCKKKNNYRWKKLRPKLFSFAIFSLLSNETWGAQGP